MATVRIELGIGYLLILPFWIAAIVVLTGRVLGVHVGRWRSALAAIVGWLAGLIGGALALGPESSNPLLIIPLSVFFGVLAALPVAIVLDVITHSTRQRPRHRRRTWLHPMRAVRAVLAPLGRFREVVGNARRENLLHVRYRTVTALASPDLARRVRLVLEKSGGMFVKFGQIAATRSDLLPETLTTELSNLHSNVVRVPSDQVTEVLEAELGEPVEQAFAQFESEPLAAASIGQTHRARLHDDTRVVVKVQRPGLDDVVARDAAVLSFVARELDRRVESARRVGVRDLADELIASIEGELDYGHELEAGVRLREAAAKDGVQIPEVYPTLSSGRMLVMAEVVGRSISDRAAVDATPVPRPELARRLLASFLTQMLNDGYYHADPHPGNVLIDAEGTLWLLDFGAVGMLDPVTREALQGMALGMTLRDGGILARSVRHLVGDDQIDMRQLERDLSMLLGEFEAGGLGPAAMLGVIDVMERHGLRPPRSMLLLSRTMVTLEGTLKTLDPTFNLPSEAQAAVRAEQGDDFGDLEEVLRKELIRMLPALRTLPEHAEAVASQLRSGRLTVRIERYAGNDRGVVEDWFNRALVLAAGAAGALASGTVLVAGSLTSSVGVQDAMWTLGFTGLTGSIVLLMRTAAQALHAQSTHGVDSPPRSPR